MSQLFARVFLQILDSSIAEDFTVRHVFEDFLKLCDYRTGAVDMTREALSRRLNIPLSTLNETILKLESPDPKSRDKENDGRRLQRIDDHRDWGWVILNWAKYETIRNRADVADRVQRHRESKAFQKPEFSELETYAAEIELPVTEINKFFDHFESNGWRVSGRAPMRDWKASMRKWKTNWQSGVFAPPSKNGSSAVDKITFQKEFDRVISEMSTIQGTYGSMQTWRTVDKDRFRVLKQRKAELMAKLDLKA